LHLWHCSHFIFQSDKKLCSGGCSLNRITIPMIPIMLCNTVKSTGLIYTRLNCDDYMKQQRPRINEISCNAKLWNPAFYNIERNRTHNYRMNSSWRVDVVSIHTLPYCWTSALKLLRHIYFKEKNLTKLRTPLTCFTRLSPTSYSTITFIVICLALTCTRSSTSRNNTFRVSCHWCTILYHTTSSTKSNTWNNT